MIGIYPSTQVVNGTKTQQQYEDEIAEYLYNEVIISRRLDIEQAVALLERGTFLHNKRVVDRESEDKSP